VLEYLTFFTSRSAQLIEVRRAAFGRSENIDLAVEFEEPKMPRGAWWCVWDDHFEGNRVAETPVEIRKRAIRRFLPYMEETVVGFRWDW
jgi:hypothetical protein